MRADQPGLGIADDDVSLGNLRLAGAQAFDFPAFERQPGLVFTLDEVIVPRTAVEADDLGRGFVTLVHRGIISHPLATPFRMNA
jgi:hypothetical protein